jgi:hypothetical protein
MERIKPLLTQSRIRFSESDAAGGLLRIETHDPDLLVELDPSGAILCQFGQDLEELRGMISGNTTEDLSDDELQRAAREHLRPTVTRYRSALRTAGFEETVEATGDHYVIVFRKSFDPADSDSLLKTLKWTVGLTHANRT